MCSPPPLVHDLANDDSTHTPQRSASAPPDMITLRRAPSTPIVLFTPFAFNSKKKVKSKSKDDSSSLRPIDVVEGGYVQSEGEGDDEDVDSFQFIELPRPTPIRKGAASAPTRKTAPSSLARKGTVSAPIHTSTTMVRIRAALRHTSDHANVGLGHHQDRGG